MFGQIAAHQITTCNQGQVSRLLSLANWLCIVTYKLQTISIIDNFQSMRAANSDYTRCFINLPRFQFFNTVCHPYRLVRNGQLQARHFYRFIFNNVIELKQNCNVILPGRDFVPGRYYIALRSFFFRQHYNYWLYIATTLLHLILTNLVRIFRNSSQNQKLS